MPARVFRYTVAALLLAGFGWLAVGGLSTSGPVRYRAAAEAATLQKPEVTLQQELPVIKAHAAHVILKRHLAALHRAHLRHLAHLRKLREQRRERAAARAAARQAAQQQPAPQSSPPPAPGGSVTPSSAFEACVIERESGGDPQAYNSSSGASGLYGFLLSTWTALGLGYPGGAYTAPASVQHQGFLKLYAEEGTAPWSPYDGC